MTPLEKDIEKALGRMVGRHGGLCLKWVCPGWSGVPDRILLLPGGLVIFVELKRPKGGQVASLQEWWAKKINALGFVHLWVKSHEDVKTVERFIVARMRRPSGYGYNGKCFADELDRALLAQEEVTYPDGGTEVFV